MWRPRKPRWGSVGEARNLPIAERLKALVDADDEAGELIWHTLSRTMAYASKRVPEIADSLVDIDNAMKWGFAWEMGPFETWDALGVKETVARLEGEGVSVAPWVKQMLASGKEQLLHLRSTASRWSTSPAVQGVCRGRAQRRNR
jgi:3-hydroxyacyl-CoA dehydrogenase